MVIAGVHSQFDPAPPDARVTQCVENAGIPEGCVATADLTTLCTNGYCRATMETVFEGCGYALAPGKGSFATVASYQVNTIGC